MNRTSASSSLDPTDVTSRCQTTAASDQESVAVFPVIGENLPPVPPPPLARRRPPIPPPIVNSVPVVRGSAAGNAPVSTSPAECPHRFARSKAAHRTVRRRQLMLVMGSLALSCIGLGSGDRTRSSMLQVEGVLPTQGCVSQAGDPEAQRPHETHGTHETLVASEPPGTVVLVDPVDSRSVRRLVRLPSEEELPVADSSVCRLTRAEERLLGTAIDWEASANEAAMIADQRGKLVFLMQVSGNFSIPEFT